MLQTEETNVIDNTAEINIASQVKGMKPSNLYWQKWSIRMFFFIGGFGTASWAPLVPLLKARLGIEEAMLGMLLLCIGIGSLLTMPTAATIVKRFGINKVLLTMVLAFAVILLGLNIVSDIKMAAVLLLIFGAVMGAIDVVVNIAAVTLEKAGKKQVLSGLHAMWSVGGFTGAGAFSAMMVLGMPPFAATLTAAIIMSVLGIIFSRIPLVEERSKARKSSLIAIPKGIVVFVGVATFISFLVEGAIMDWSGVFLLDVKNLDVAYAGLGFSCFSAAMLIMRFSGDALILHFGPKVVIGIGTLIAITGFLVTIVTETGIFNLIGFFLIGVGMANVVPTFYSVLGKQSVMPIGMAVSAVSTLGYLGILAGPAIIGFIAHATSLSISFMILVGLLVLLEGIMFYTFNHVKL